MIKNTFLILISVLMFVFGILAIVSSGYEYAAEKLSYRAQKTLDKIAQSPEAALPNIVNYAEKNLQEILQKYPNSKEVKQAHLTLAELYIYTRRYVDGLSFLYDFINKYPEDKNLLAKAYLLRATAFEKQGDWDKALREYAILRDEYSDTPLGLAIPLYIGDYYATEQKFDQADQAYNEAIQFYKRLERNNRGKASGYAAANLLMRAYMRIDEYKQAGQVLEEMIDLYPKLLPLAQQMANIETIFVKELAKPDEAIRLYKKMRTKTNNAGLINTLDEKIRALEAQR